MGYETKKLRFLTGPKVSAGPSGRLAEKFFVSAIAADDTGCARQLYLHKDNFWYSKALADGGVPAGYYDTRAAAERAMGETNSSMYKHTAFDPDLVWVDEAQKIIRRYGPK